MLKPIFMYDDPIAYLTERIRAMPARGRGESKKMARSARVSPAYLSQILRGSKPLGTDHAILIAGHLGLSPPETDYFLELVRQASAGNSELAAYSRRRLAGLRKEAGFEKAETAGALNESELGLLFSNWHYDAVRLATSIPSLQSVDAIAEHLKLTKAMTAQILDFLIRAGLCVRERNGRIRIGQRFIKIASDSPHLDRHLLNWRALGNERIPRSGPESFYFSLPMPISPGEYGVLQKKIRGFAIEMEEFSRKTRAEGLACLNLDLFPLGV